MEIAEQVGLAPHTTMGLGGPARWFAHARHDVDVRTAWAWARERDRTEKALVGLGRTDQARRTAARFRRQFPKSVLLHKVDEMLASKP